MLVFPEIWRVFQFVISDLPTFQVFFFYFIFECFIFICSVTLIKNICYWFVGSFLFTFCIYLSISIPVIFPFQSPNLQPVYHVCNCFSSYLFFLLLYINFISVYIFLIFFPEIWQLSCHLILLSFKFYLSPCIYYNLTLLHASLIF